MDLCGIIHESTAAKTIQIGSRAGQTAFIAGLHRWSRNPAEITHRAKKFSAFKHTLSTHPEIATKLATFFATYTDKEQILDDVIKPPTKETTESNSQLIFTHPDLKPLNFAPFLLTLLYIIKVAITPLFAVLMPIMLIALPYVFLKYIYKLPISFDYYWNTIQSLIFKPGSTMMEKVQRIGHMGWLLVGVGQSMLAPVMTAKHVYSLNSIYSENYEVIKQLYGDWCIIMDDLESVGWRFSRTSYSIWFNTFCTDPRMFIVGLHENTALKCWIRAVGDMHVSYSLATTHDAVPVRVSLAPSALILRGAYDPQISPEKRKLMDIDVVNHILLTGPNRGGKSTALRAILINVILAQTYGVSLAKYMQFAPFEWVHTCLKLEDIPGSLSLFEREVFMAARSLQRIRGSGAGSGVSEAKAGSGPGLILIDELFHSTNPSDSNRAAKLYIPQIWQSPRTISIISTHDFDLVETAPAEISRFCCPATETETGTINYTYTIAPGICRISSVNEILQEKGVCSSAQI